MSDDEDEDVYALKPDQKIPPFNKAAHMKFFSLQLDRIPPQYGSMVRVVGAERLIYCHIPAYRDALLQDTSRMTLLYFVLSALDVLGVIDAL